jgi:hypothetical protein
MRVVYNKTPLLSDEFRLVVDHRAASSAVAA